MRHGNHTVAVRRLTGRVDGAGDPVLDQYGRQVQDTVDTRVRWCLVVPSSRFGDTTEPRDRSAPRITGTEFYGPPGMDLTSADVVVWPVETFTPDEPDGDVGTATGPTWQVEGDVGVWDQSTETRLRRAT